MYLCASISRFHIKKPLGCERCWRDMNSELGKDKEKRVYSL